MGAGENEFLWYLLVSLMYLKISYIDYSDSLPPEICIISIASITALAIMMARKMTTRNISTFLDR